MAAEPGGTPPFCGEIRMFNGYLNLIIIGIIHIINSVLICNFSGGIRFEANVARNSRDTSGSRLGCVIPDHGIVVIAPFQICGSRKPGKIAHRNLVFDRFAYKSILNRHFFFNDQRCFFSRSCDCQSQYHSKNQKQIHKFFHDTPPLCIEKR